MKGISLNAPAPGSGTIDNISVGSIGFQSTEGAFLTLGDTNPSPIHAEHGPGRLRNSARMDRKIQFFVLFCGQIIIEKTLEGGTCRSITSTIMVKLQPKAGGD